MRGMKILTKIFLGLGGFLFVVDGAIKLYFGYDFVFPVINQTMPCGVSLILIGLGLLLLIAEKA